MKTKTITAGLLSAVVAYSVLFTSSASAFWPFDALFNKGEVKAVQTDKMAPPYIASGDVNVTKAEGLAKTLSMMKSACETYSSSTTTTTKPVPTTRETANTGEKGTESPGMYREETSQKKMTASALKELNAINSILKNRCAEVNRLITRLNKIYTAQQRVTPTPTKEGSVTPTRKPIFNFKTQEVKRVEVESDQ